MKYRVLPLALGLCLAFAGCAQAGDSAGPEDSESTSACAESVRASGASEQRARELQRSLRRAQETNRVIDLAQDRVNMMRSGPRSIDGCFEAFDDRRHVTARYERVEGQVTLVALQNQSGYLPLGCLRPPLSRLRGAVGAYWHEGGPQAITIELRWTGTRLMTWVREAH